MIAANAMTILNVANESFSGLDLSGINVSTFIDNKWQGPNISGGTFGGTDFSGANLRGSMLFDSFLGKANLTNTKLDDANLGIVKKTFNGHSSKVISVSMSSDGKFIASGSNDKTVKLWEVKSGPLKVCNSLPDFTFHNFTVLSTLPEAINFPSVLRLTLLISAGMSVKSL